MRETRILFGRGGYQRSGVKATTNFQHDVIQNVPRGEEVLPGLGLPIRTATVRADS